MLSFWFLLLVLCPSSVPAARAWDRDPVAGDQSCLQTGCFGDSQWDTGTTGQS